MTSIKSSADRINTYMEEQTKIDTLRFITCGSVDDGKSTLIGRLLFEANLILDDQIVSLQKDTKKIGRQNGEMDFSLLVDGLIAEREQNITIDVAYRYFSTDRRRFIVADTPGHEQYTRNMITGASTANLAIILIDARKGLLQQTRRHTLICSTLGIKRVVLAVNKMDLVDYSEDIFSQIEQDYLNFAETLDFSSITAIPVCAVTGDNLVKHSKQTEWYHGPALLSFLETVKIPTLNEDCYLRLPVQWINRPNTNFKGFSGTIASGTAKVGQNIRVLPSREKAKIKEIIIFKDHLKKASEGEAITITLDRDIDISRGDVIVASKDPCDISDHFEAQIVWTDQEKGYSGRKYLFKLGTVTINAQINTIKHKVDINSFERLEATELKINDISIVTIQTDVPIPFEPFSNCGPMGSFILIDRYTHHTVAAGMINFGLRRAKNLHWQKLSIDKDARRSQNEHFSKVLWFTGLSGSGKTTIANALEKRLHEDGIRTYILDGDNIRHGLNNDLGFTVADRVENIRRVAEVAKLFVDAGVVVLTAFISPFKAERQTARDLFQDGEFIEIFVDTPLEVTEQRDPKGLYKKARKKTIPNFTGIDSPYEIPENPDITVSTETRSVDELVDLLRKRIRL